MVDRSNPANERTGRPAWRRSTILHFHIPCPSVGESVKPVRKVYEKRQRQGSQSSARHLEQRRSSLSLSHGDTPSRCQLNTFVRGISELFENLGREGKPLYRVLEATRNVEVSDVTTSILVSPPHEPVPCTSTRGKARRATATVASLEAVNGPSALLLELSNPRKDAGDHGIILRRLSLHNPDAICSGNAGLNRRRS